MAKYESKTRSTDVSPADLIAAVANPVRQRDALTLMDIFARVTGFDARVWGPSMIGFGRYDYVYDSGHSGSAFAIGFAPRKAEMVVYVIPGYAGLDEQLARLGPHKLGKSCLYLKDFARLDVAVLEEIIASGFAAMQAGHDVKPG
jgi:hypothetical protein